MRRIFKINHFVNLLTVSMKKIIFDERAQEINYFLRINLNYANSQHALKSSNKNRINKKIYKKSKAFCCNHPHPLLSQYTISLEIPDSLT